MFGGIDRYILADLAYMYKWGFVRSRLSSRGGDERMYGRKGWTEPIIRFLENCKEVNASEQNKQGEKPSVYIYSYVPVEVFKDVSKRIPRRGLRSRQNRSPTLGSFLRDADELEGVALYVVPGWRHDERVTVEGAYVKGDRFTAVMRRWLNERGVGYPDEIIYYPERDVYYVWWD